MLPKRFVTHWMKFLLEMKSVYKSPHSEEEQQAFMQRAVELGYEGCSNEKGGPFGCVIVKDGQIVGEGFNQVTSSNDPTAHAEMVAIRAACKNLNDFQLKGCEVYTSCEPCPMCLGAIYWARPDAIFFGNTKEEAAAIGFDDHFIYEEIEKEYTQRDIPTLPLVVQNKNKAFDYWKGKEDKVEY